MSRTLSWIHQHRLIGWPLYAVALGLPVAMVLATVLPNAGFGAR
jgi:hypothetical protein